MDGRGFGIEGSAGGWKAETHLAPLFPEVLSKVATRKNKLYQSARYLNATLFAVNVVLAGVVVAWGVGVPKRFVGALAGAAAFGLSPVLVEIHSMVWSEPLFITLWFATLLMTNHFGSSGKRRWLLGAAAAAGLACVDRYSAMSLVLAVSIWLFFVHRCDQRRTRRLIDVIQFCIVACLPIALLMLRNWWLTGSAADRSLSFHPPTKSDWHVGMVAVSGWLLPHANRTWVAVGAGTVALITVAVCVCTWRFVKNHSDEQRPAAGLMGLLLCCAPVYALFLTCSVMFADAHTVFDNRILCPVYLPLLLLTVIVTVQHSPTSRRSLNEAINTRRLRMLLIVAAVGLLAAETVRAAMWTGWARANGLGYSNTRWQRSDLLRHARALKPGTIIYSNAPDALMLFSDAAARPLPKVELPGTKEVPASYRDELLQMRGVLKAKNTFIYFFHRVGRTYVVSEQQLIADLHLNLAAKAADGNIYTLRLASQRKKHPPQTRPAK